MSRKHRPYLGLSDAQANAEALARRGAPYAAAHAASVREVWGGRRRPLSLRELAYEVRASYAEGIPEQLHDPEVGDHDQTGAPRYSAGFAQRLYGSARAVDRHDPDFVPGEPGVRYHLRAFDAALEAWRTDELEPLRRVVWRVACGEEPIEAVERERIPPWAARTVAYDVLRRFLASVSAIRIDLAKQEGEAAA